ncbi:type II toxin-antitoxin system HicB family antitoxin [Vibrio parahaemolyticus]|nr:type II toxin-antitoxin system HicB family antitoxin [Vibrio parahaemolyticus]MDN4708514.1 type II toxin-antitoxin system HicB family antitoxin [Vibrio parahaemolyticus]MDN4710946.1 type II toxin-antitoxin system HicB family antitoxin [Vibrio parahaemolyticus]MDN4716586.1 type II toxin-antitoxin system HicB family antitoxin [Vibrio parahaemolyticus]MDN4718927.1 type II toxin-antitoxin system HicB family antitoxin [Vibrio parahaemolyticus]
MWFTLGVETPKDKDSSYGIIVPALCNDRYSCYSASDSSKDIAAHSAEAIESILEEMLADGFDVLGLEDQGRWFIKKIKPTVFVMFGYR